MATDYWRKREDAWIEECEKDHEKYMEQIHDVYQRMYDELEEQVELFYQRYAENEGITMQEARKRLTNAEMEKLSRKAKEYCELAALDMRNQNRANEAVYFSEEANAEMAKYNATMRINRLEMLKQYVALSAMKAQANVAGVTRKALTEEAMKQHKRLAGILGNTVAGIEGKAKAIAEASFHGQKYSERIWGKNQDELIKRLNKIITDAIIQGKNSDTAIKKMAKDFNVTQSQAKRLVETELQRVKATVYKNQYKESEFDAYEYHAYPKCCPECRKLNGTKHPLKELEPGYTAPPLHPSCRCSTTPAVDMSFTEKYSDKDVDDFDAWCDYMEKHEDDPEAMTWKEWKERDKKKETPQKAKDLTKADYAKLQKTLKAYMLKLENNEPVDEKEAETALDDLQKLIAKPFKEATAKTVSAMQALQDKVFKTQAICYLKYSAGIDFIDAKSKKNQISGRYLKEFTNWHKNFTSQFKSFSANSNYVHLPKIEICTDREMGNAYGMFTYYSSSLAPVGIKLKGSSFHTYESATVTANLNFALKADGTRFKSGNSPIHTIVHEYGHYVANSLDQLNGQGWQERFVQRVVEAYAVQCDREDIKCYANLALELSSYGAEKPCEAFAEAFSDYFGEENPHDFSKLFGQMLEKELRK